MRGIFATVLLFSAVSASAQQPPPPPPLAGTAEQAKKKTPPPPGALPPPPPPVVAAPPPPVIAPAAVASPPPPPVVVRPPPPPEPSSTERSVMASGPKDAATDPSGKALPPPPAAEAATAAGEPAKPAAAKPPAKGDAPKAETADFVKGELSSVGADRMTSTANRIGVAAGYNRIGRVHYALIEPQVDLHFGKFRFGIGVPLNLEFFNQNYPREPKSADQNHIIAFDRAGKLRTEDWDELSEYARPIIYITYGNKEDHLFVNVGQRYPASLGHGTVMRRYAPNLDVNVTRVSAEVDAYNDYLGMEAMTNDVFRWSIVGLIGFLKPLSLLGAEGTFAKSVSLGATFVVDREAPSSFDFEPEPACPVGCASANVPKLTESNQLSAIRRPVSVAGFDVEGKVLKTESVDLKTYLDYSSLLVSGGGGGFTAGLLGRFNFGKAPIQAVRMRLEARYLGAHYRPSYFDTFYEIDKFLWAGNGGVKQRLAPGSGKVPATKLEATIGPDGPGSRAGYYAEVSYGIREVVGLTLALEGEGGAPEKNFIAHLELPAFSILRLFGSFYKRGFTSFSTLTSLDETAIAFAGARLKILPILFLNARAFKTFELDAYRGKDGPLGTLQYQNAIGYAGDLEFGYEF